MRKLIASALVATVVLVGAARAARADAPPHPFGLGLMVGSPTGLSAKLYLGSRTALAMGLGESYHDGWGHDDFSLHTDFLFHPVLLAQTSDFFLPLHVGVGARLHDDDHFYCVRGVCYDYDDDIEFGVRAPVGITMDFTSVPIDVFFEVILGFDFDDDGPYDNDDDLYLTAALGARYYF